MKYVKDRVKEPSTLAGITMLVSMAASALGWHLEMDKVAAVSGAIGGLTAAFEVFRSEK